VGRSGVPLVSDNRDRWICPVTGEVYVEAAGRLEEAR
jgi:UDP-2-acetamido-3-amino-2,3-dideoxy-glucuronate N-acetyltransferase